MSFLLMITAAMALFGALKAISPTFVCGWFGGVVCVAVTRLIEWSLS